MPTDGNALNFLSFLFKNQTKSMKQQLLDTKEQAARTGKLPGTALAYGRESLQAAEQGGGHPEKPADSLN